jgi:DNA-directed RNA polymerase subunit RPC12/RpoP
MELPHLLVDQEPSRNLWAFLTDKILCLQCMFTWWIDRQDLTREVGCPRCGHRARVELDKRKVLQ